MFKHVKQMHMEKTVFVLFLSHEYDLRIHNDSFLGVSISHTTTEKFDYARCIRT